MDATCSVGALNNSTNAARPGSLRGIARIEQGNFGDTRNLGGGVWERRFLGRGAGARLYYALADAYVVILLVAGDKSSAREQQAEIALEREYLEEWSTRLR